jgi:hypothetical protein
MKKVLLVLAAMLLVAPAFAAPELQFWFSGDVNTPGTPGVADYGDQTGSGMVTLYLWTTFTDQAVGNLISTIGLNLQVGGDATDAAFVANNPTYTTIINNFGYFVESGPVTAFDADLVVDDNIHNLKWAAVSKDGLPPQEEVTPDGGTLPIAPFPPTYLPEDLGKVVSSVPALLGTLTFNTMGGASSVEILVGPNSIGNFNPETKEGTAVDVLFGGGEGVVSGDYVANGGANGNQGDGVPDAVGVPEPTTMILLGLGALGVLRRRS